MSTISASTTTTTAYKVTADTTGTLVLQTGATPTTAVTIGTNQVVTFAQQPAGTFAGTGPAFSAYSGTVQTVTTSTWTKVNLTVKTFDTNSNFDPTTNYRFTPTVAGYYMVTGSINMDGAASLTNSLVSIYKNGSNYCFAGPQMSGTYINGFIAVVTALIYMNGTTDYIELYGFNTCVTTPRFNTSASTKMDAFLARAA